MKWRRVDVHIRITAGKGKERGKRKISTGWRGKGERKVKMSVVVDFSSYSLL